MNVTVILNRQQMWDNMTTTILATVKYFQVNGNSASANLEVVDKFCYIGDM